jgi:hypothetical protein
MWQGVLLAQTTACRGRIKYSVNALPISVKHLFDPAAATLLSVMARKTCVTRLDMADMKPGESDFYAEVCGTYVQSESSDEV